jgi:hypothetical protein
MRVLGRKRDVDGRRGLRRVLWVIILFAADAAFLWRTRIGGGNGRLPLLQGLFKLGTGLALLDEVGDLGHPNVLVVVRRRRSVALTGLALVLASGLAL